MTFPEGAGGRWRGYRGREIGPKFESAAMLRFNFL